MPSSAIGGNNVYPSLQDVANQVRSILNDDGAGVTGTVGEGQIVVDNASISLALINFLNLSIGELYRELRNSGDQTLIADNYIVLGLTPVNGPNGVGGPSPETQVQLGYTGYFDGTTLNSNLTLPINMLVPLRVWQRQSGTGLPFTPMAQAQGGLAPAYQGPLLGAWEWRSDGIWFNGATVPMDIRIRYKLKLPFFSGNNLDYTQTYIPIQDCVSAVAYKVATKYAARLGSSDTAYLDQRAKEEMLQLKNEQTRRAQGVPFQRPGYGDDDRGSSGNGYSF